MSLGQDVYGLDLGTYDIKIFDKKKDRIWHAKNVIAMKDKKYIFSVGDDAYEMYEKAPGNIQIIFPMRMVSLPVLMTCNIFSEIF